MCASIAEERMPLVWDFDSADRLLNELADNEPLISLGEYHVGGLGDVGARFAHGDADVGRLKRDAVARHADYVVACL